jgi:hypothetical protein
MITKVKDLVAGNRVNTGGMEWLVVSVVNHPKPEVIWGLTYFNTDLVLRKLSNGKDFNFFVEANDEVDLLG